MHPVIRNALGEAARADFAAGREIARRLDVGAGSVIAYHIDGRTGVLRLIPGKV